MIVVYAVAKFLAYSVWCYLGLRLVQPAASSATSSVTLGALRWFLGLFFGIVIFFMVGSIDAEAAARTYLLVYSPVRALEWGIMAFVIVKRVRLGFTFGVIGPLLVWCVGGILVSFLTDLVSPEGIEGRFCVGRCLC